MRSKRFNRGAELRMNSTFSALTAQGIGKWLEENACGSVNLLRVEPLPIGSSMRLLLVGGRRSPSFTHPLYSHECSTPFISGLESRPQSNRPTIIVCWVLRFLKMIRR